MRKAASFILLCVLLAGAFLAGSSYTQRSAVQHNAARKVLYYVDPMHPAYRSNQPGIAPDCGMKLVAVYADEQPQKSAGNSHGLPAGGAVAITAEQQQLFGVRVSEVEKASAGHTLRLFGRVVPDEARVYKMSAGIDGFIQEVFAPTTGSQVQKDQLLATFSAPNASSAVQTYILNAGAQERLSKMAEESMVEGSQSLPAANWNVQQRIQQLQNVGVSLIQIEEIRRTHQIPDRFKILAPAAGFVLARNVSPGMKFERGAEWYRIADLRRVWILADVSEIDAPYVRPGMRAQVSLPNQARSFVGRVADVLPQFDPSTRTLKARIEMDNPGFVLRPDMFVDVELAVQLPSAITVPTDAIVDSGLQKTVFVERGAGFFEPRAVETGWRLGDEVEVVKGLKSGERIVVSGSFLVDSETRLKTASAGMYAPAKNEKGSEHEVGSPGAPERQQVAGKIETRQVGR